VWKAPVDVTAEAVSAKQVDAEGTRHGCAQVRVVVRCLEVRQDDLVVLLQSPSFRSAFRVPGPIPLAGTLEFAEVLVDRA